VELGGRRDPARVGLGAVQVVAAQAGCSAGNYEGAEQEPVVVTGDDEVRQIVAHERQVAARREHALGHLDNELRVGRRAVLRAREDDRVATASKLRGEAAAERLGGAGSPHNDARPRGASRGGVAH
jgi:phosphopentomutase